MADEFDHDWMGELHRSLEAGDASALLQAAESIHYADLAATYENLDNEKRDFLLKTIGPELATDVVAELLSRQIRWGNTLIHIVQLINRDSLNR